MKFFGRYSGCVSAAFTLPKSEMFLPHSKNVKCALKPQSDERAREMFAHTAAKRRIANVAGSVPLHPLYALK